MKTIDPNKVAIYIRWSTDDQSEGTTLQTQQEGCQYYILSQGWNVNEALIFIDDGYSGGNLNRPAITKMRQLIEQDKIDCVVVLKLDRLSRSVVDAVNLIKEWEGKAALKSAREQFDTDSAIGKLFFNILASFADWERAVIKERTFSGKIKRSKEGKNSGFIYPYGYKKGKDSSFEIVPEEAEIVKKIYQMYLNGRGSMGIAVDLNEQNITNRNGKQWSGNTILYILKNKVYVGILEYGRTTRNPSSNYKQRGEKARLRNQEYSSIDSPYIPAIISIETFNAVQKARESRSVKTSGISGRALGSEHLLTGILKCKCGYSRFGANIRKGEKFAYYECSGNKSKGKGFCDSGWIRQDKLDKKIIEHIKNQYLKPENFQQLEDKTKKRYSNRLNDIINNIKTIENTIKTLDSQLNRLDNDYRLNKMDIKIYNRFFNQIEIEKNSANIKLAELKNQYENEKNNILTLEQLQELQNLIKDFEKHDIMKQKMIIRKCVNSITAYKKPGIQNQDILLIIDYK